ncbi:MAG: hypothetical protein JKY60_01040 [Kordiimonadaceae bacterium]|nr:hypothetical protein [Kordiimonadaceae bacterium]
MLQTLKLLLPALLPSWRFFDAIAPSPRIEFSLLQSRTEKSVLWQEFRPRPPCVPASVMLTRMVYNPRWNETLFLVSCAERLTVNPTKHSQLEILNRIKADLAGDGASETTAPYLQYRLHFVSADGEELTKQVTFTSPVYPYSEDTSA